MLGYFSVRLHFQKITFLFISPTERDYVVVVVQMALICFTKRHVCPSAHTSALMYKQLLWQLFKRDARLRDKYRVLCLQMQTP